MKLSGETRVLLLDLMEEENFTLNISQEKIVVSSYRGYVNIVEVFSNFDAAQKVERFKRRLQDPSFLTAPIPKEAQVYTLEELKEAYLDPEGEIFYSNGVVYYPDNMVELSRLFKEFSHVVHFPEDK